MARHDRNICPGNGVAVIRILLLHLLFVVAPASAMQPRDAPEPILPETLMWFSPPGNPQFCASWVLGAEKDAGTYVMRVMLESGGTIPAHTHPDTRYITVLRGTLHVGFGRRADDAGMVAVPAGAGLRSTGEHAACPRGAGRRRHVPGSRHGPDGYGAGRRIGGASCRADPR